MLKLFRFVLLRLVRWIYRVEISGAERIPTDGGALLVANHATWIDSFLISLASERPVRFIIYQGYLKVRPIAWFIRLTGAIPINGERARDAIRATSQAVNDGHLVCLFPEGQLSRSGLMCEIRKGIQLIAREVRVPVIPLYMDGLWGSVFSFERERFFFKWPRRLRQDVRIFIGKAMATDQVSANAVRQRLEELSVEAFSARAILRRPLATAVLDSLKRKPTQALFVEHSRPGGSGKARRKVTRASAIAAAIALAARWRSSLPEQERRVGILLPGGAASAFMNLGLVLAGRVPVNLPFGGSQEELAEQLDQLGIRTVLTSRAFAPALEGFPWRGEGGTFVDLRGEIDAAGSVRMLLERARACLEPKWMAHRRLGLSAESDDEITDEEAFGYLWRDGESEDGEWRTTFLSHFEVQAAVAQLFNGQMLEQRGERIFCEHGMNSAAGALFALWVPVLGEAQALGRSAAARAEGGLIEAALSAETATLMISSAELRTQIEAGEEWHPALAGHLERIFNFETELASDEADGGAVGRLEQLTGVEFYHGWAPDQAGAVASLSLPNLPAAKNGKFDQPGQCSGSVGRLLPGTALIPGETLPPGENWQLWMPSRRGDRRHPSGRRGTIDEAGFVFLEEE